MQLAQQYLADIDGFDPSVANAKGKIYNDVNLSVGVSNFLFYGVTKLPGNGKLKASYLEMTDATNWATGFTTWAPIPINKGASKVGDYTNNNGITFDLVPIRRGWTLDNVKADTKAIATIAPLNAADLQLAAQINAATEAGANAVVTELTKIQKTLRNELTDGTYTAYAGSSESIKSLMVMLYNSLKNREAALTAGAVNYATLLYDKIDDYFTVGGNAENGFTLTWKDADLASTTDVTKHFPANLGVPDGAAAVQYKGTAAISADEPFEFVTTSVEGLRVPAISNYTYPASLYYTINTPSMVLDEEYLTTNDNTTNNTWALVKSAGGYTLGPVAATTRSVILQDQVQYAVGRLDVAVRVKPETIINDNSKSVAANGTVSDNPQPVSVPTGGYKLTGVLIGGQKQVGWNFLPISDATEMTIWDNTMASDIYAIQQEAFSAANYTLALETAKATSDNTGAINIALEFENTGNDFCGINHNLIPAGTKFYLVAQLDPSTNTTYMEQDPETPWNPTTTPIKQVIKQDYVTTVNLTIGANSLKSAYNVVPDLRSPKLEFGLSVDLHWRSGITFDVEL